MIKILINYQEKSFKSLEVKGHAKSAENGKDLVCAGVSAVVTGGLNNLSRPQDFQIELKEGYVSVVAKELISTHDAIVMETIIAGLKSIEESYKQFISIKNL